MADIYVEGEVPTEYDPQFFVDEFHRIAAQLQALEIPTIILVPQNVAPTRLFEGLMVNADGTNWNPGHGGGLYAYEAGEWVPLFSATNGFKDSQTLVENTTTETEIYSSVVSAESLHIGDTSTLAIGGSYDVGAASDTWTLRLKFNGTTLHTVIRQSANNITGAGWKFEDQASIRTEGVSGTMVDTTIIHDDDSVLTSGDVTSHTIDTTVDNTISVTVQWGAAKVANIFRCEFGSIGHE